MINLKLIENEIKELTNKLEEKRNELAVAREANLKEQYGEDFGCDNCAYSCCVEVGDYHTCCTKNVCIHCCPYCDQYMPENELSAYIREHHYYHECTVMILNDLFNISDIMKHPELYQTALKILKLRDSKED